MKKKEALTLEDIRESVADTRTNYIERYGEDVLGSLTEAAQTGHILLAEVERLEASYVSRPVALMMLAALDRAGFGAVGRDNDLGSMTRQVCEEVTRLRAEVERLRAEVASVSVERDEARAEAMLLEQERDDARVGVTRWGHAHADAERRCGALQAEANRLRQERDDEPGDEKGGWCGEHPLRLERDTGRYVVGYEDGDVCLACEVERLQAEVARLKAAAIVRRPIDEALEAHDGPVLVYRRVSEGRYIASTLGANEDVCDAATEWSILPPLADAELAIHPLTAKVDALVKRFHPTNSFSDSPMDLLRRVAKNVRPQGTRTRRWSAVGSLFGLGSTSATALCTALGVDPEEEVGVPWPESCPVCVNDYDGEE